MLYLCQVTCFQGVNNILISAHRLCPLYIAFLKQTLVDFFAGLLLGLNVTSALICLDITSRT